MSNLSKKHADALLIDFTELAKETDELLFR